jgi:hypothetical protein
MHGHESSDAVLDGPAAEILAGDFVLIVALVRAGNAPYATRGWGLEVLSGWPVRMRLLLSGEDALAWRDEKGGATGFRVAVTVTDPRTMRSVQFKGRADTMIAANDNDRAVARRFCDSFFAAVKQVEGTDRSLLERMVPNDYVACAIVVDEFFDQTPGPGAGVALSATSP